MRLLCQCFFDRPCQRGIVRGDRTFVSPYNLTLFIDQKLFKIPRHFAFRLHALSQLSVERMLLRPLGMNFIEQRKTHVVARRAELLNLFIAPWLLHSIVVARKR
jgi:hypothetical protein